MTQSYTTEQRQLAAAAGIDLSKIPWDKVIALVKFLIDLFGNQHPVFTGQGDDASACLCKAICLNCCAIEEMTAHLHREHP